MMIKKQILLFFCCFVITQVDAQPRYINPDAGGRSNIPSGFDPVKVTVPEVPKNFTLFGEKMPLEIWDVQERFDRELLFNTYLQGTTAYILKLMGRYMPMIEKILKEQGIPDDFKYLCIAESALRNQTSRAGAVGFWQFMKSTAPGFGLYVDSEVDEREDPLKSTYAACKYLRQAYNKFGNWTNAAASYNCGMGGLNGNISRQGSTNFYDLYLPEETMRYIFRIAALKYILENNEQFGFHLKDRDIYQPVPTRVVTISGSLGDLAGWARSQGTNYKTLKLLNPWLQNRTLYNKSGRTYQILLPR